MTDTASAGGATGASLIPSTTDAFTAAHLAIIAIFAVLTIVAIVWGIRLKRQRRTAERDIAAHNAEVERTIDAAPTPTPAARTTPTVPPVPAPAAAAPTAAPPVTSDPVATDPIADEPIAASAPLAAAPAQEAASAAAVADPVADSDPASAPVSTLKGLGPKLAVRLGELGITTVGQVAALSADEAAALDAQLGPFAGRLERDRWIEQARFLAAGDTAGFERVFGRL